MTDEQIVKELQCASEWFTQHGRNTNTAIIGICGRAVDLINRQKAEIERLKIDVPRFYAINEVDPSLADLLRNSKPTICLLTDDSSIEIIPNKETIRAEAIKDFAERLKENEFFANFTYKGEARLIIDNLVKEMIGEKE